MIERIEEGVEVSSSVTIKYSVLFTFRYARYLLSFYYVKSSEDGKWVRVNSKISVRIFMREGRVED